MNVPCPVTLLKIYLSLNVLIAVPALVMSAIKHMNMAIDFSSQLRLIYLLLAASIIIPISAVFFPADVMPATSQIWTSESMRDAVNFIPSGQNLIVSFLPVTGPIDVSFSSQVFSKLFFLGFLLSLGIIVFSMLKLYRILSVASDLRRYKTVKIMVSDQINVPLSFWLPFHTYVVIPGSMVGDYEKLRLSLAHEMQHHRQSDTKWLHVVYILRALCFWNPLVYLIDRQISNLQEFACDEALVGHRKVSSLAYCRCLLWVAEKSLPSYCQFVGTASMAHGTAKNVLRRRVELMLSMQSKKIGSKRVRWGAVTALGTLSLTAMFGVALAANSGIQDRRVSKEQATGLVEVAKQNSNFPIVVNESVLEQLNRFVGTPDGREYMRQSILQMQNHIDIVLPAVEKYRLPVELLAVPIVESGYRNLPQDNRAAHGAGIWMFIKTTGRHFGLKIDDKVDERLNVRLETDAAMRLLSSLNLQFRDWGLALLGYNAGAGTVQRGIRDTGSRDVWHLVQNGYDNDPGYVAKVMAAVIIIKNPSLLD